MLQIVRNLGRRLHRKTAHIAGVRIDFKCCKCAIRLHGTVGDFVGDEASFGDLVGVGETLVRVAEDVVIVLLQIVRLVVVDEVALRFHGVFGIEGGGKHSILDIDEFEGALGGVLVYSGDAGNVVSDIAYLVSRHGVLVVTDGKDAVGIGSVFAGNDGDDSIELLSAGGVDALDDGVRIGRVQDLANQHAG